MWVPLILFLLAICGQFVCAAQLDPIPWDSTKFPQGGQYVEANLFDQIDFVCPRVANTTHEQNRAQYNIIYQVPKKGLDDCDATVEGSRVLHVCDEPFQENRYSLFITDFSPIPGDFVFETGREYHYISVGDGTRTGMSNKKGGNCLEKDMKLTIKICCGSPSSSSPTIAFTTPTKDTNLVPDKRPTTKDHGPDKNTQPNRNEEGSKKPQTDYSTANTAHQTLAYGLLIVVTHILIGLLV